MKFMKAGIPFIKAFGLKLPMIKKGDDIAELLLKACEEQRTEIEDGDIFIITEKIVSKSHGRVIDLRNIEASEEAEKIARKVKKDPRLIELILRESRGILKTGEDFIITETKHGFICANAGIDFSNVDKDYNTAKLLPENPDKAARDIREEIERKTGKRVGVVISDSFGRPFRKGSIGVAIGASGIKALYDRRGEKDIFGKELRTTRVAIADMLASLGNLICGEASEGIPAIIVKTNLNFLGEGNAKELIREKEKDVFRK